MGHDGVQTRSQIVNEVLVEPGVTTVLSTSVLSTVCACEHVPSFRRANETMALITSKTSVFITSLLVGMRNIVIGVSVCLFLFVCLSIR